MNAVITTGKNKEDQAYYASARPPETIDIAVATNTLGRENQKLQNKSNAALRSHLHGQKNPLE